MSTVRDSECKHLWLYLSLLFQEKGEVLLSRSFLTALQITEYMCCTVQAVTAMQVLAIICNFYVLKMAI